MAAEYPGFTFTNFVRDRAQKRNCQRHEGAGTCVQVSNEGLSANGISHNHIAKVRKEYVDDDHDIQRVSSSLAESPAVITERGCCRCSRQ